MSRTEHLRAFAAYGIELEYMIVDCQTLAVRPICDQVLRAVAGEDTGEVQVGDHLEWSNELVGHVIELKTAAPTADLKALAGPFLDGVRRVNSILERFNAMLLPTAMHPTMQPERDMQLYPYGDGKDVYETYHRIFDCRGHGWSNLQSVHINLPFFDDTEFARLHAAVRLVLPILPALAASSPIFEGRVSGLLDSRLEFYRHNQRRVPEIAGKIIPERAYSRHAYETMIFSKIYEAIAPHDPAGELRYEWLNSRGAIARFDRHAIEIRVLDIQESPTCDAAMVAAVVSLVRALYDQVWIDVDVQQSYDEEMLQQIFVNCLRYGEQASLSEKDYLRVFGWNGASNPTAGELWRHLAQRLMGMADYPLADHKATIIPMLEHGTLATRILAATGHKPDQTSIDRVYRNLAQTLATGGIYLP